MILIKNCVDSHYKNTLGVDKQQELAQLTADVSVAVKELLPVTFTHVETVTSSEFQYANARVFVNTYAVSVTTSDSRAKKVVDLAEQVVRIAMAKGGTRFFPYVLLTPVAESSSDREWYHTRFATS